MKSLLCLISIRQLSLYLQSQVRRQIQYTHGETYRPERKQVKIWEGSQITIASACVLRVVSILFTYFWHTSREFKINFLVSTYVFTYSVTNKFNKCPKCSALVSLMVQNVFTLSYLGKCFRIHWYHGQLYYHIIHIIWSLLWYLPWSNRKWI